MPAPSLGRPYIGRFAPSPTGPLHAGSLVAALASWLDARAHGGQWLVRLEDLDRPRCKAGAGALILQQLSRCGLHADAQPVWQSHREDLYQKALDHLIAQNLAYPCACSRQDIATAQAALGHPRQRHVAPVYPGTCRAGPRRQPARVWRLNTERVIADCQLPTPLRWRDRRLGWQQQNVAAQVGDFVLRRADGCWAYQLAVVTDDAAQGVSHVVRGADLSDNTARQILLQQALGLPTPHYLHTPLVLGQNGEKLSKQNGALAFDSTAPQAALQQAAQALGLVVEEGHQPLGDMLQMWVRQWSHLYNDRL